MNNQLRLQYTMNVERENLVLNRKLSNVIQRNRVLLRDLREANSNVDALEDEVNRLERCVYYLDNECDPENDEFEVVSSPLVFDNHLNVDECAGSEKEGENTDEENLEPAENEVNEEPALDMSASDYEKEQECEVSASGECECVKSVGVLELKNNWDWTTAMSLADIARY